MLTKQVYDKRLELSGWDNSKVECNREISALQSTSNFEQQKVNELKQEKSMIEDRLNFIKNTPAYVDLGEKAAEHVEKYLSQRQNFLIVSLYLIRKAFLKNPEFANLLIPTAYDVFDAPLHSKYLRAVEAEFREFLKEEHRKTIFDIVFGMPKGPAST